MNWSKISRASNTLAKLLIPIVILLVGHWLTDELQEREIDIKERELSRNWVKIAISILSSSEFSNDTAMRDWAVRVINHYVEEPHIQIRGELSENLIHGESRFPKIEYTSNGLSNCIHLFSSDEQANNHEVIITSKTGLNLRSAPSWNSSRVGVLASGRVLVAKHKILSGYIEVQTQDGNLKGWANCTYLSKFSCKRQDLI